MAPPVQPDGNVGNSGDVRRVNRKDYGHAATFRTPPAVPNNQQLDDDQLPLYSVDGPSIDVFMQNLAATLGSKDDGTLPILTWPPATNAPGESEMSYRQRRAILTYFDAITTANLELVTAFLDAGIVTAETTNQTGKTPLLAAVEAGKISSIKHMLQYGANINKYAITATSLDTGRYRKMVVEHTLRTPLQYAAELGNLAIVKLLMECGADDSLIAPDGQLALRLAASNGHREVVEYLPGRSGGGFRRWQANHKTAMRRCKKAALGILDFGQIFLWSLPKFFIWEAPRYFVVDPFINGCKWVYTHRAEIPGLMAKYLKKLWNELKALPKAIWKVIKEIPGIIKTTLNWLGVRLKGLWEIIKSIPHGLRIALLWIWDGVQRIWFALENGLRHVFALMHTFLSAIISFFQHITWKDVWRAFVRTLHAIFIDAPMKVWGWMCMFEEVSYRFMKTVFGFLGQCLWVIGRGIISWITYVPEKLFEMLAACGSSLLSGGKEVMVWINPKKL